MLSTSWNLRCHISAVKASSSPPGMVPPVHNGMCSCSNYTVAPSCLYFRISGSSLISLVSSAPVSSSEWSFPFFVIPRPLAFIVFSSLSETHLSSCLRLARPCCIPLNDSCVLSQQVLYSLKLTQWYLPISKHYLPDEMQYTAHITKFCSLQHWLSCIWITRSDTHVCRFLRSQIYWIRIYRQEWESEFKGHIWWFWHW